MGDSGLCEPTQKAAWVTLLQRRQRMPPFDFTFRFDAPRLANVLLSMDHFAIGTSFVEIYEERHEFPEAKCMSDECTYTVSVDEDRLLFWVGSELAGVVPMTRWVDLHNTDKIVGDDVINARYLAGVVGPQSKHLERQLQSDDNCHPRCDGCTFENDPTACVRCNSNYYYYDTAQTQDPNSQEQIAPDTYILCIEECGSGIFIEMSSTTGPTCKRPSGSVWIRTVWDKFLTYGQSNAKNEFKPEIGVTLKAGMADYDEYTDPIPAYQRGLYFNGYSSFMTFEGLSLGTEFNFGYWCKPFHFDGLFTVFGVDFSFPGGIKLVAEMNRREPQEAGEHLSVNWVMRTVENFETYYATSIADEILGENYQLEDVWWLLNLKVGSGYSNIEDGFASSYRIYWNNQFGGDTINVTQDFFEDSNAYFHVIGRTLNYEHFHGFVSNIQYYNFAQVNFPELFVVQSSPQDCETCLGVCPSQPDYYECVLRNGSVTRECRGLENKMYCPDCCEEGHIWIDEACQGCGNLCSSCSPGTDTDGSLMAGECDYSSEYAMLQDIPARNAICDEGYVHDTVNNRCCEPFCASCAAAPFECDQCFWGYRFQDKSGVDNFGLVLMGNMCIPENCINGFPSGDELCQCSLGHYIENETCNDTNECSCRSGGICTCVPIPCYEGCDLCNSSDDFSKCYQCAFRYLNNPPVFSRDEEQYAYCVPVCPSGFDSDGVTCTPQHDDVRTHRYWFNDPVSLFYNHGSTFDTIDDVITLHTELPSGVPVKNRGVYFDGVKDGYLELPNFVFNHSWSIVCWTYTFSFIGTRQVQFQKEDSFVLYTEGTNMGLEIYSQNLIDTRGHTSSGMTPGVWGLLSIEAELISGRQTNIRIYMDDQTATTASVANFLIDTASPANIGINRSISGIVNRWNGYVFDLSVSQSSDSETYRERMRTSDGCATNDCWDVEFNQYKTEDGQKLSCSADCINDQKGCINSRDCRNDCQDDGQWCHLCFDYMCWNCGSYEACDPRGCAPTSDDVDGQICVCQEPEYGRAFNIDAPCAECHDTCETCVIEGINGCLTCDEFDRTLLDPDNIPTACICMDGLYPDPTHSNCSMCHENCLTCFGGEAWQCHDGFCADGLYQWTTSSLTGATNLCLHECPTGYITHQTPFAYCERPTLTNWHFGFWPRQNTDLNDDGVTISASADNAPIPVYGRGMYFDGTGTSLEVGNINLGTEFSLQIWFRADAPEESFNSLFSIYDELYEDDIFKISRSEFGDTIQATFISTYGTEATFASSAVSSNRTEGRYSITGQWNFLGYTQWAVKNQDEADTPFGTECRFFINNLSPINVYWEYGEYMEDLVAYQHKIGVTADGNAYKGHIASINLFNWRVDGFGEITYISTNSCPTCSLCPVAQAYTQCVDDCEFDMNGTCVTSDCADLKEPICPVDCDVGQYQQEDLSCVECKEGGNSCRIAQNERVCDDILCELCYPLYEECNGPGSCVVYATWDAIQKICVCDHAFDETTYNCCYENCIRCSDPTGVCDECAEFWFGDFCETKCVNGTYEVGSPGSCTCDQGWSGPACDVPCNPLCLACDQTDPNECTLCPGNTKLPECSECLQFWFLPVDCDFKCVNGLYVAADQINGTDESCQCNDHWSGEACDVPCNVHCKRCEQFGVNAENICTECPGNQQLPDCTECLEFWFKPITCEVYCVNGTYVDGNPGTCSCDNGWSGPACDVPCNSLCLACDQTDPNECTICPGNQKLSECSECLQFWFLPTECDFHCVNGLYVPADEINGTVESCECNDHWSGAACDVPCNVKCKRCEQFGVNAENICTECPGNQQIPDCTECLEFWFKPITCLVKCVNGTYVDGNPGTCSCDAGWSGAACDIPCNEECVTCDQFDPDLCLDCPGNKAGDECELCITYWFPPGECDVECVNGTYNAITDSCDCDEGWSGHNCNTRCNSRCKHCRQDDPDICVECPGNQALDQCDTCLENWYEPLACDFECINGTYIPADASRGTPRSCQCDERWSGIKCDIPCKNTCLRCLQDNENICTECPGNQKLDDWEECLEYWYEPLDCDFKWVNGTYIPANDTTGDRQRCDCFNKWSGEDCNTPCNQRCERCLQNDPNVCIQCPGRQLTPDCDTCWENWFEPMACDVECIIGQGVYNPNTQSCMCLPGWSGMACNMPCHPNCVFCSQTNANLCTECPPNKTGDLCDVCVSNWDIEFDCLQCLPGYFHESVADQNCQLLCVNGDVSSDYLACTCWPGYAQALHPAPHGQCELNDCFAGCAMCHTSLNYKDCMICRTEEGWVDPNESEKADGQQRTCTKGCPTGYITESEMPLSCTTNPDFPLSLPQGSWLLNLPTTVFTNNGTAPSVSNSVCSDGTSGVPAKNRGLCLNGEDNGVMKIENYLLNTSFTFDAWYILRDGSGTCTLMYKLDLLDLRISYGDSDENEMGTIIGTEGQEGQLLVHTPQTQYITIDKFQHLIYSYTELEGESTDARYYIDGNLVKHETLVNQIIVDDITKPAYIGGKYESAGAAGCDNLVNKCNGCIYDLLLTQVDYNEEMNRPIPPLFWEALFSEFIDEAGDVQDCDVSCNFGCVDGGVCLLDFDDDECQFCYLCHDRDCISCDTYETCQACESTTSYLEDNNCICLPGYGRKNKAERCSKCHSSCLTCNGPNPEDCLSCHAGTKLDGDAPSTCICEDGWYQDPVYDQCRQCHPTCFQCVGPRPDDCIECHENGSLAAEAPAECVCNEGYYLSAATGKCLACHPTCKNCTGPHATDCYECKFGAYLTREGECLCYVGPAHEFTTQTDASQCEITQCGTHCSECSAYPWSCRVCKIGAPQEDNFCGCPNEFTYQPDTRGDVCVPDEECHYTCATCFTGNDPNACLSCYQNGVLRFDDRPTWCDCSVGFYPSWTTDNCVAFPPIQPFPCVPPCVTCDIADSTYCLTCNEGSELSNRALGTCVCKVGYRPDPDSRQCQFICEEPCKSCLLSDTELCTSCIEGYKLSDPKQPSACVPDCPENCCECDGDFIGTCSVCCPGYMMAFDDFGVFTHCELDPNCHVTCKTCVNSDPLKCTRCFEHASIVDLHPPLNIGPCECDDHYMPTPDASFCDAHCYAECATCDGPAPNDCTSCHYGYAVDGKAPGFCKRKCHYTCKHCFGPELDQCNECGENLQLWEHKCICPKGYELDPDLGCFKTGSSAPLYDFVFNSCKTSYETKGIRMTGASYDHHHKHPLPVSKRGVFFNNKTYFIVEGLVLSNNFSMNTWLKSHDTGYATIFATSGCAEIERAVEKVIHSWSWRLSNSNKQHGKKKKRSNAIEVTDWSNQASRALLQAWEQDYRPLKWNNLAFSSAYDWETDHTTITFFTYEYTTFYVRAAITMPKRFGRSQYTTNYTIGNRSNRDLGPMNSFLGFIYYFAIYTYPETDFGHSVGMCTGCLTGCGPHNVCLSECWYDQLETKGQCVQCSKHCEACFFDRSICYCESRHG